MALWNHHRHASTPAAEGRRSGGAQRQDLIVDAMSSWRHPADVTRWASISDQLRQQMHSGRAGLCFRFQRSPQRTEKCAGRSRSLSLDLYAQWRCMEDQKPAKRRFTSPTHTVLAFAQALKELNKRRHCRASRRYHANQRRLWRMRELGFEISVGRCAAFADHHGVLFAEEVDTYRFAEFYQRLKQQGYRGFIPASVAERLLPSATSAKLPAGYRTIAGGRRAGDVLESIRIDHETDQRRILDQAGTTVDFGPLRRRRFSSRRSNVHFRYRHQPGGSAHLMFRQRQHRGAGQVAGGRRALSGRSWPPDEPPGYRRASYQAFMLP